MCLARCILTFRLSFCFCCIGVCPQISLEETEPGKQDDQKIFSPNRTVFSNPFAQTQGLQNGGWKFTSTSASANTSISPRSLSRELARPLQGRRAPHAAELPLQDVNSTPMASLRPATNMSSGLILGVGNSGLEGFRAEPANLPAGIQDTTPYVSNPRVRFTCMSSCYEHFFRLQILRAASMNLTDLDRGELRATDQPEPHRQSENK
jgi:hypothetical protein